MVDNFDIIKSHLTFESPYDRYIVHIIKRAKDEEGKKYGVNETNRLLKTFYITSLEYFDKKIPVIKDLCESNNARAYILPQVRDNSSCLKNLLKLVVDNLDNPTQKPDHLIRSAYCGFHGSRDKKWILDIDNDNLTEYICRINYGGRSYRQIEWTPEKILDFIISKLKKIGKTEKDAYMVPTKNGHCIVTSPFNLKEAFDDCSMMFEGVSKKEIEWKWTGPDEGEPVYKNINGWIIKDGMAMLFCP